jgi:hypothetical protein
MGRGEGSLVLDTAKGIGSGTAPRLQFGKEAHGNVAKRNEIGLLIQPVRMLEHKRARVKSKGIVGIFRPFSRQAERFGSPFSRQRDRVSAFRVHVTRHPAKSSRSASAGISRRPAIMIDRSFPSPISL